MRILQISTCWARTPPTAAGGVEWVVSYLTEQLVRMGHDVTLFATADSITSARLLAAAAPVPFSGLADEVVHVGKACEYIAENHFDIVHNHHYGLGLVPLYLSKTPCVTTLHVPRFMSFSMLQQALSGRLYYVALSRSQRELDADLPWFDTVHNGIDVGAFPFEAEKGEYLLHIGRICRLKGTHHAIAAAKRARRPLVIAGPVEDEAGEYYEREIAPHLDGTSVIHVGEVGFARKVELYQGAAALLFTSLPECQEPCPLVAIEALACGTPVISFANGALPEIIEHDEVGFIVEDAEEMSAAVGKLGRLDPAACRRRAESHFSSSAMAANYVEVYEKVLRDASAKAAGPTGQPRGV